MNNALLFLDRATQGQGGSVRRVCINACTCGRSPVHTVNTVSEAYNQGTSVDTTRCDYNSEDIVLFADTCAA